MVDNDAARFTREMLIGRKQRGESDRSRVGKTRESGSAGEVQPGAAIRFRLEQGLDDRALIGVIGGRSRVYEVMKRRRALSLEMIRRLHEHFGIPAEVLIRPTRAGRRRAA